MRMLAVLVAGALCGVPAATAAAQEPAPRQGPPETVADTLIAMKQTSKAFLDAMLRTQFKVDPEVYPGIAGWVTELQAVRDTWSGEDAAAWKIDTEALTTKNPKFWAALLETFPGDPMMLNIVAAVRMMEGEGYRATHCTRLGALSPGRPPQVATAARRLSAYCGHLFKLSAGEIKKGIVLHDVGEFVGAIKAYRDHLAVWPQDGWAHYELGQSMMVQGMKDKTLDISDPKAPHHIEYALCRRYQPMQRNAWQGMTPELVQGMLTMMTEVQPGWQHVQRGQADVASLQKLSEGAQKMALHDLALFVRTTLAGVRNGYTQADRDFIATSLRALAPGEQTDATIARLNGEQPPLFMLTKFQGEPPAFQWKKE